MKRIEAISQLADLIGEIRLDHPIRIGIDGVDCSGKTMLADELVDPIHQHDRKVIRASIDGFHNPREIRYRQGRSSPRGYFEDSFNIDAVLSRLLLPLGSDGSRSYTTRVFDFRTDSSVKTPELRAGENDILIFEGVFLHRPEFFPHWDFTVFVDTGFDVTIRRAFHRDRYLFKTENNTREIYEQRYIPGQRLYIREHCPSKKANVVFRNDDIENPELIVKKPFDYKPSLTDTRDSNG